MPGALSNPASHHRWPLFLLQSGLTFERDPAGRLAILGSRLERSARACRTLIHSQPQFPVLLTEAEAFAEELFRQEKVSSLITTYFNLNRLTDVTFPYDIAPLPHVSVPATLLVTVGLAVRADSPHLDETVRLVDYLTSEDAQRLIREQTLSIPACRKAAELPETGARSTVRPGEPTAEQEAGEAAVNRPPHSGLYRELIPSFRYSSDLHLTPDEHDHLLLQLKQFWMGLQDWQETEKALETRFAHEDSNRDPEAHPLAEAPGAVRPSGRR